MHPQPIAPVPEDTARVTKAAFPKGNVYMHMRDVLGSIYDDEDFSELFEVRGRPTITPWRLALVTVMQFSEGLSDRQAAEAVRALINWKYALGLRLSDPGFDFSVLSEFRSRLIEGGKEELLLEKLLEECKKRGYLKMRGRQRTDSTHVLGALRVLSKWERTAETMRAALNVLASVDPEWLAEHAPARRERKGSERSKVFAKQNPEGGRKPLMAGGRAFAASLARTTAGARLLPLRALARLASQRTQRNWKEQRFNHRAAPM